MQAKDYVFERKADGAYQRKCYGYEALGCQMIDQADGFPQCVVSTTLNFKTPLTRETLKSKLVDALILSRHHSPGIALKIVKLQPPETEYALTYDVPKSLEDANAWANAQIEVFDDVKSILVRHGEIRDCHWWRCDSGSYIVKAFIAPSESGWHLSILIPHCIIDGRGTFTLLDIILKQLNSIIDGTAKPTSSLSWGEETPRLPLPGPFVHALVKTGSLPAIPDPSVLAPPPPSDDKPPAPPSKIPWVTPPVKVSESTARDLNRRFALSKEVTSKLHAASKAHGVTITNVASAFLALAFTESLLKGAAKAGEERFKAVYGGFTNSTHFLLPMNFVDQRARLPDGYNSLLTPENKGVPFIGLDCAEINIPLENIRKLVAVDEGSKSVERKSADADAKDVFWKLVGEAAADWKQRDISPEMYFMRSFGLHMLGNSPLNPAIFGMAEPFISSIGDMSRLGLLEEFRPSKGAAAFTVEDIMFTIRMVWPPIITFLYEFDEVLYLTSCTGEQHGSDKVLDDFVDAVKAWIEAIL